MPRVHRKNGFVTTSAAALIAVVLCAHGCSAPTTQGTQTQGSAVTASSEPISAPVAFDDLWDYGDPEGTAERLEALRSDIERQSRTGTGRDAGMEVEWLSQLARTHSLRGNVEEADRLLRLAESKPAAALKIPHARVLLERGRLYNVEGRTDDARASFVAAWDVARAAGDAGTFFAVDAAHMLAIIESGETAWEWHERGLEVADASADPLVRRWIGSILNNMGWAHHSEGRFDEALSCFEGALDARLAAGRAGDIAVARWCIGRTLRSLGRCDEALRIQEELALSNPDGYVQEELGECLLALGRSDEAEPYFVLAYRELSQDRWLCEHEPDRIARLKQLARDP